MGAIDGIKTAIWGDQNVDPKICKTPSGQTYSEYDLKHLSTTQLNKVKFVSGFEKGTDQADNCLRIMEKAGLISSK